MVRKIAFLLLGLSLLITSCTQAGTQTASPADATPSPTAALTPYSTLTAVPLSPTATFVVTIPVTPSPTPTPFLHTVTNDDTMLGLAIRYGVKLEDLKTANPQVNPNAMSVGSQLVIPIEQVIPEVEPTSTAVPVQVAQPHCVATGDGGAWCIVALHNDLADSLENLSVWIGLYSPDGANFTSQVAYAPLNILRSGATMPLMAYFPPPLPEQFTARSELLSALSIAADDVRYLDTEARLDSLSVSPDGSQADLSGQVILADDAAKPASIWVLAVAYDVNGQVIGARKWKSAGETAFTTTVYSLGGAIDNVEVLVEARP